MAAILASAVSGERRAEIKEPEGIKKPSKVQQNCCSITLERALKNKLPCNHKNEVMKIEPFGFWEGNLYGVVTGTAVN